MGRWWWNLNHWSCRLRICGSQGFVSTLNLHQSSPVPINHRPASDPFMLSGLATRSILGVWLVVGWDHVKFRSNVLYWPVLLVLVLIHAWLIENILLLLLLLIWLLRHAYFREYTYKVNHLNYKEEYYNGDSNEMWEYTLTKSQWIMAETTIKVEKRNNRKGNPGRNFFFFMF